jgi:hypothetical protein
LEALALTANAFTPEPEEEPAPDGTNSLRVFSNWEWVEGGSQNKPVKQGVPIKDICADLYPLTDGLPKRVDNLLFVPGDAYRPRYLETAPQLFAWLDAQFFVNWGRASDMISQERLLAHLQETADRFDAIECYPHWPPIPGAYYLHPPLPATNGQYLESFVNFFSPYTDTDRDLIRAFVMSLAWGGPAGARPAWLFTAPEDDPEGGRGVGKSICIGLCGELVGGMLEISPSEDIVAIKKRLLSPAARTLRLARIDNIKTYRFSWADLEALITSPVISGHRMYKGEGRRPNTLTWALTLNGASLSKDLAKRVIVVTLRRPTYRPTWEQEVRAYIAAYRWHILNDIRLRLQS